MSAIGIDFILRANTTGFTQGLAKANNSITDLKHEIAHMGGGRLAHTIGIAGVVEGFRLTLEHAQKTREELEKLGRPVDEATRSVARYADAWDGIKKTVGDATVQVLSFFTKSGEGWGMLINRMRGVSAEQEKIAESAKKGADQQEKNLADLRARQAERGKTIDKDISDQDRKNTMDAMTKEERRNKLLDERTKIYDQIDHMVDGIAKKEKILEAAKLTNEIGALGRDIFGDAQQKKKKDEDEEAKRTHEDMEDIAAADRMEKDRRREVQEKFAPSVEQLANMSAGGFASQNDPRIIAKKILEKEAFAAEAGSRGDIKGAMKLGLEAKSMRDSLADTTGSGAALTAQTAQMAVKAALEDTNKKLEETNKELSELKEATKGIIKAQK